MRSVCAAGEISAYSVASTFNAVPLFGLWGRLLILAGLAGSTVWHLRRRCWPAAG